MSIPDKAEALNAPTSGSMSALSSDTPPIITFPEFLLHTQKPPPLITVNRILNTLYTVSGVTTVLYGTSRFVINPMIESLSSARHSLFSTASQNIEALNEKIERLVSVVPEPRAAANHNSHISEGSSVEFNPTELFHRSVATQTISRNSRSASPVRSELASTASLRINQHTRLQSLHTHLADLLTSTNTLGDSPGLVTNRLKETQHYLDTLSYSSVFMMNGRPEEASKDDKVARVKAEIRGFKGLLLSARNFPSGVGARGRG